MAFDRKNLCLMAYGNGQKLWHYRTTDAAADVDTAGYFNDAWRDLQIGDIVFGFVDTDGTPAVGLFGVISNSGGVVDVADMVSLTTTDTD